MVAENALPCIFEHAAIVDAEVRIVVHCMGVKSQIKRISLEKVMVNQGNEAIQHPGDGENRRQGDGVWPFDQGLFLHKVLSFSLEQGDDVQNHLRGLHHALERHILQLAVEVVTASEDIGTWQTHER